MRNIKTEYYFETGAKSIITANVATGACHRRYLANKQKSHKSSLDRNFWKTASEKLELEGKFMKITRATARKAIKIAQSPEGLPLP